MNIWIVVGAIHRATAPPAVAVQVTRHGNALIAQAAKVDGTRVFRACLAAKRALARHDDAARGKERERCNRDGKGRAKGSKTKCAHQNLPRKVS